MIRLKDLLLEIEDYRGDHTAPEKEVGTSLDNLSGIYPDDIYGPDAIRSYGSGEPYDWESMSVIQSAKGRPNRPVKIYRAIPSVITTMDKMNDLENQMKYIHKHGKVPPHVNTNLNRSEYYDKIWYELEKLKSLPNNPNESKVKINPGDWVTTSRSYAKEHGESTLLGRYRILSKTVPAKTLFTTGDSIHEWGYNP